MPLSEACLAGIRANGHRWKHTIGLGQWPALLGKLNDQRDVGADDAEVERCALKIVALVRAFVDRRDWAKETDLARLADDLEMVADCGLAEVNEAMGELYDSFDYWRILVEAPRLPASGMSAGTAETRSGSGPKDRQPDPKGDAQTSSPSTPEIPQ